MNIHEKKNSMLVTEFDRYVRDHPELAEGIPEGALVALQVEGDDAFNDWSRQTATRQRELGQPVVHVTIRKLKPIRSRIEELKLAFA